MNISVVNSSSFIYKTQEELKVIRKNFINQINQIKKIVDLLFEKYPNSENLQEVVNQLIRRPQGFNSDTIPSFRSLFKEVESKIIYRNICQLEGEKIIELGAGAIDKLGYSYLMTLLPKKIASQVEPTEINNYLIANTKLKKIDSTRLSDSYPSNSLDVVLGSAFLDTLSKKDLNKTIRQVHQSLKPGGKLIHFTSLVPFIDTLLATYTKDDIVLFPWFNEREVFEGLFTVEKSTLFNFINTTSQLLPDDKSFLEWYANLPVNVKSAILQQFMLCGKRNQCREVSQYVESMNLPDMKKLKNIDFYENRIKEALQDQNFKILKFEIEQKFLIIKEPDDWNERFRTSEEKVNMVALNFASRFYAQCYVLAPGYIYQSVRMHVIMAEKY